MEVYSSCKMLIYIIVTRQLNFYIDAVFNIYTNWQLLNTHSSSYEFYYVEIGQL